MYPWDDVTPRFYPPGQHPAMIRHRTVLRRLEQIADRFGGDPEFESVVRYHRETIAAFEEGESEAKVRAALRYH